MLSTDKIKRLNELAAQSKRRPLSDSEATEQKKLREEYLQNFKSAMRNHLDNIEIVDTGDTNR